MCQFVFSITIAVCLLAGTLADAGERARIVFNPERDIPHFRIQSNYEECVRRSANSSHVPPGLSQSMRIETIRADEDGPYWRLLLDSARNWGGQPPGNTTERLDAPIEIEFFVEVGESVNLPDAGVAHNLDRTILEFRFGSCGRQRANPGNDDVISLRIRRRFFLSYNNYITPRDDRTGQWLVLSLRRDGNGNPTGLFVGSQDTGRYELADPDEVILSVIGKPDWSETTVIRIESWYTAPDNHSFYIGRIALGQLVSGTGSE